MQKRQLLLIEDEGYVVSRVQEILSAFPYLEVTRTDDAEQARALLDEKPFDIVLTDVYLRGASGLEFSFKALQKNKDACVILITGIDNADMAAKAVREGAFDFLVKPPGLDRLGGIIRMLELVKGLRPAEDGDGKP